MAQPTGLGHERPRLSIRDAATATGVSPSTIKRKTRAGEFAGAAKDAHGVWTIPVDDLLAAGYRLAHMGKPMTQPTDLDQKPVAQPSDLGQNDRIRELERELAEARAQRDIEHAKREAADRVTVEAQRGRHIAEQALLMIEARNPRPADILMPEQQPPTPSIRKEPTPPPKRRWWHRS